MDDVKTGVAIMLDVLELHEGDLDERQIRNVEEFVRVTMGCDNEMMDGIDHQIPMTADLYHRTVEKLVELGAERTLEDFVDCFGKDFGN